MTLSRVVVFYKATDKVGGSLLQELFDSLLKLFHHFAQMYAMIGFRNTLLFSGQDLYTFGFDLFFFLRLRQVFDQLLSLVREEFFSFFQLLP